MVHAHEHFIIYLKKRLATTVAALLTIFSIAAQTTDENNFPQKQLDIVRQTHNSLNDNQKRLKKHLDEIANKQMEAEFSKPRDNSATSADGTPRLRVSLLTCGPGSEIYEYYGHSAIRVMRTDSAEFDLVFNYGVFDFDSDNFALRFALGETDYLCQCQPTKHFLASYERSGRFVDEQVLNLSQEEARRLFAALLDNAKPENATYRYNFFYDNCATRVRDIIEKNLNDPPSGVSEMPSTSIAPPTNGQYSDKTCCSAAKPICLPRGANYNLCRSSWLKTSALPLFLSKTVFFRLSQYPLNAL